MTSNILERRLPRTLLLGALSAFWVAGCAQPGDTKPIQSSKDGEIASPGALPRVGDADNVKLNATTFFAHGHLLERQGNFVRAAEQYRRALEVNPNFVAAHNRLGITLNKLGEHTEASEQFRLALKQDPRQAFILNNLGFSQYLEGDLTGAAQTLREALAVKPDFARAAMNLGVVLARTGQYDQALSQFKSAGPEADAYYNIAVIQAEKGEFAAAARSLDAALSLNPQFEVARAQLREVSRMVAAAPQRSADAAAIARGEKTLEAGPGEEPVQLSSAITPAAAPITAAKPTTVSAPPAQPRVIVPPHEGSGTENWADTQAPSPAVQPVQPTKPAPPVMAVPPAQSATNGPATPPMIPAIFASDAERNAATRASQPATPVAGAAAAVARTASTPSHPMIPAVFATATPQQGKVTGIKLPPIGASGELNRILSGSFEQWIGDFSTWGWAPGEDEAVLGAVKVETIGVDDPAPAGPADDHCDDSPANSR